MTDQKAMWNQKHAVRELAFGVNSSKFAQEVVVDMKPGEKVLELGCGFGGDARLFAKTGARVVATDFSEVVIAQDKQERGELPNLRYEVVDITEPLPYASEEFDVAYSQFSLHYWNEVTTQAVFAEITRVLKPGGKFYFNCKSEKDPKFGEGVEIKPGVFARDGHSKGHIRHFFSPEYTRHLLAGDYEIIKLEEVKMVYSGDPSVVIQCWARKSLPEAKV